VFYYNDGLRVFSEGVMRLVLIAGVVFYLTGCGGSNKAVKNTPVPVTPVTPPSSSLTSLPLPDNTQSADYRILFIGNSHTSGNQLPTIVENLIKGNSDSTVEVVKAASSAFLSEHIELQSTLDTFHSKQWTHVVLQAQKVSSSQSVYYPTDAAKRWVELTKSTHNATPVFFAEHPQKGNQSEALHIHNIYSRIADEHPACVAPIGHAWDNYKATYTEAELWSADGNHANINGSHLTALVLYSVITGEKSENIQTFSTRIDEQLQQVFAQISDQTNIEYPACNFPS